MNRLALALALARGDVSPEQGEAVLAKAQPAPDLVKGGGSWVDIPGDEHEGEQKLYNDRFIRRWPSAEKARQAATRYEKLVGQAAVARDAAEAAGTSASIPYNSAEWRYRELARCAADFAELLGKGLRGGDLLKALIERDCQEVFDDILVKADGGGGAKPPNGYAAIPGSQHGGFRKKTGKGWSYWYPDTTSATAAVSHHTAQAEEARKKQNRAAANGDRYAETGGKVHDSYRAEAAEHSKVRAEHAEHAAGAAAFLGKQTATRRILDEHADTKKRKEEGDKLPETAPEGKHYISERGGVKRQADTVAAHGNFTVHGEGSASALRPGNSDHSYPVTHKPSGMVGTHARTKNEATDAAKHFHEHAGDAGSGGKFGEAPGGEDMKRLGSAYQAWAGRKAKKAMDDWQPFSGDPAGAPDSLVKGFAGLSGPAHMGVRPDAFKGLQAPQLRKGFGDAKRPGVGACFDSRWNDGLGVGRQG